MKILTLRLDPKIWKLMSKDKELNEMNWEQYIEWLFNGRKWR